jgi:phosphoribosylanthranilate isomerase
MWIKICGTTNLTDAHQAVAAGADALGFVFAPSARRLTAEQARSIVSQVSSRIATYGVFTDPDLETIVATVEAAGLTGVQLHTPDGPDLPLRLRERFRQQGRSRAISVIRVLHFREDFRDQLACCAQDEAVDAVLVDSQLAHAKGGTGIPFDWSAAKSSFDVGSGRLRLIAAGGLGPENVAEAIETLSPWGVDAVSGLESAPGRKDPRRVADFIRNAREAFARRKTPSRAHPGRG